MKNKYIVVTNLDDFTKKVYEKFFKINNYEIMIDEDNVILVKQGTVDNIELEKSIAFFAQSILKKYRSQGILCLDLTDVFMRFLNSRNKENRKIQDMAFLIRQALTKAISEKNRQINKEFEEYFKKHQEEVMDNP